MRESGCGAETYLPQDVLYVLRVLSSPVHEKCVDPLYPRRAKENHVAQPRKLVQEWLESILHLRLDDDGLQYAEQSMAAVRHVVI